MHAMVIDNQYLAALEKAFIHLGLTDGQEAMLDEQANSFHAQRLALLDSDAPIHEEFKAVINSLTKLSN